MIPKITLKQIAKHFNVSITTVSKSLKDSYEISTETKEKIQQYAEKHHYTRNPFAVNLQNKRTKTIGIIIPNILNNFFAKAFIGVEKVAAENGYQIIACISNESYEKEVNSIENLNKRSLDGLILSLSEGTQIKNDYTHLNKLIQNGIPVAMFDRVSDQVECDKIIVDDFLAAYNTTLHFIKNKAEKIGLVTTLDNLDIGKLRIKGYLKALLDNHIPANKDLILKIDKHGDLETQIKLFLDKNKGLDAIFALDEITAVNILKIAQKRGYDIPKDFSVICFVNGLLAKYTSPSLTTVSQHGEYIGENIAKMLIKRIENTTDKLPYTTKIIKTNLIIGESTKKMG